MVEYNEPIQIGRGGRDSVFKRQPLFVNKHHVRRTYYYYCHYNNYSVNTLYQNNEMNNSRYCIVRADTYIGRNNTHARFEYYTKRCKLLRIVTTTDNNKRKKTQTRRFIIITNLCPLSGNKRFINRRVFILYIIFFCRRGSSGITPVHE